MSLKVINRLQKKVKKYKLKLKDQKVKYRWLVEEHEKKEYEFNRVKSDLYSARNSKLLGLETKEKLMDLVESNLTMIDELGEASEKIVRLTIENEKLRKYKHENSNTK